ncbi:MAG: FG-GAP repeat domain-containing protein [Verrucomicrobiales bacterium]
MRRPRSSASLFKVGLGCLALGMAGCEKKPSVDARSTAGGASEVGSASPAAAAPVAPIVAGGESKETVDLWSEAVKSQLYHIASAVVKGESLGTEADAILEKSIGVIDPASLKSQEVFQDPSFKVVEVGLPKGVDKGAMIELDGEAFIRALREQVAHAAGAPDNALRFKLYGITAHAGQLTTRQRLMARGTHGGKKVDSYAVVDASWVLPAKDDPDGKPRLKSFSMPRLVRNELADSKVMFEDIAGTVLGSTEAWRQQLQWGMNTWVRHIERSLNPDFLGYHGLAMGDIDRDGLEDIYFCQPGGLPNLLFRRQPDGTLTDISAAAGVDWLDNSTGALLLDLDNDGDADLAVATRTAFLIMENDGKGKFALRERLSSVGMGYSPTAADYDLDGDLDLLVLRYAGEGSKIGDFPTPHPFHNARNGGANVLLQNQGGFVFKDVTEECGLGVENYRFSFSAAWEDFDNDGRVDLYIANDFGPNQLFRNEGGSFVDVSAESGTQDWGFGMSATWADYNRDGLMDIYVSSMFSGAGNQVIAQSDFNPSMSEETRRKYLKMVRGNSLLRNAGNGRFDDITDPMAEGFGGWAWGAKFADFNNDGWEDLYVANGYVSQPDKDDL